MKFKIGDKVQVINNNFKDYLLFGRITNIGIEYEVTFIKDKKKAIYHRKNLKLIKENKWDEENIS